MTLIFFVFALYSTKYFIEGALVWTQAFLLLLACGTIGAAAVVTLIAGLRGQWKIARNAGIAASLVAGGYLILMVVAALAAGETTLAPGAPKYICELDCHLAYTVVGVDRDGRTARIQVQIAFDRATVRDGRDPAAALTPGGRTIRLRDSQAREYKPVEAGDFARPLRPGESYTTDVVFDVEPAATGLILYITDSDPAKMVMIGSDNGPFRRPAGLLTLEQ